MKEINIKSQRKNRRLKRIRSKILDVKTRGARLRLSVFRSNKSFYAQIIDDLKNITLISGQEREIEGHEKLNKTEKAVELGKIIAKKAIEKGIKEVVFDKGSYRYHGRVRSFAESARKEGLNF